MCTAVHTLAETVSSAVLVSLRLPVGGDIETLHSKPPLVVMNKIPSSIPAMALSNRNQPAVDGKFNEWQLPFTVTFPLPNVREEAS